MPGPPVENWRALTGPSGWFDLWHPPQWRVEEEGSSQTLCPPDGEARMAIHSLWTRAAEPDAATAWPNPEHSLSLGGDVRRIADESVPHCRGAFAGARPYRGGGRWWQRLFLRPQQRDWQAWMLQRGPILVLASLEHGAVTDPEFTTLCRMVLQSIQFAETPAAPPELFLERVEDLARRRFPLLDCRRGDGLQLVIGESTLNLVNFYRTYIRAPERFEEIVLPALTTVVQVQEWGDAQTRPPLEQVRERIMPMLYPESAWQERFARFVGTSWVAGLAVLYVVDEAQAYWYIPRDLLEEWGLTEEELHRLSLVNVERYFERHPMELAAAGGTDEGAPELLMPLKSDSYNAARIVSGQFTDRLRDSVGGDLAVGVPGRDFFVAVSLKSSAMLEHVRDRVKEDFANMDHPLTDRLLLVTTDGACEYCDPETA